MIEKRFTIKSDDTGYNYTIQENGNDLSDIDAVFLLNELHEDNQRLELTLQKKEELLRNVLKVNDNLTKKIRELEEDNTELKEAMKRMMGDFLGMDR